MGPRQTEAHHTRLGAPAREMRNRGGTDELRRVREAVEGEAGGGAGNRWAAAKIGGACQREAGRKEEGGVHGEGFWRKEVKDAPQRVRWSGERKRTEGGIFEWPSFFARGGRFSFLSLLAAGRLLLDRFARFPVSLLVAN